MIHELLLEFLEKRGNLSSKDRGIICSLFALKTVAKGEFLLRKGDICNEVYFIKEGVLRAWYFTEKGLEFTRLIKKEKEFCSNLQSFTSRIPSIENIQAIENSTVLTIKYEDFVHFTNSSATGMSVYRKILEEFQTFHIKRFEFLTSNGAQNKVALFFKNEPDLAQRINSKIAASYLQMSPETYSRIKNKLKS